MPTDFITRFEATARRYPGHVALQEEENTLRYDELLQRIDVVAGKLKENGADHGKLVALELPKSIDYVVAMLAVWKCGAAFVPVEPSLPDVRKQQMLAQCRPLLHVTPKGIAETKNPTHYPETLAYIIFTSGSTGAPKGVMLTHAGLNNILTQQMAMFDMTEQSRMLWILSQQFDASLSDIGVTLLSGATLVITGEQISRDLDMLGSILHQEQITHLDIPPTLLPFLSPENTPDSLRTIVIGGEVCAPETVRKWASRVKLINVYGPTEATICTSMRICGADWSEPNIGAPIKGVEYDTLDGELLISTDALALGYCGQPELTAWRFITHKGQRAYRTGDRVHQADDGSYIWLGRIDRQVKITGKLIAPEEIEAALLQHPDIARAAVITPEATRIAAVVEAPSSLTSRAIRNWLKQRLPLWMLPHRIDVVETLPVSASGKVDYPALKAQHTSQESHHAPASQTQAMQQSWQRVLHLPELPAVTDDFFDDLGGDSLKALEAVVDAETYGLHLPSCAIHSHHTIAALLEYADGETSMSADALKQDVASLIPSATVSAPSQAGPILLTGATGFLGIHLLAELQQLAEGRIVCLLRAESQDAGQHRLSKVAAKYGLNLDLSRIDVVCGNIAQPRLGLNDAAWEKLAKEAGAIWHSAAELNALKPYAQLRDVNVIATASLLELANTYCQKPIHYVSTLSVLVSAFPLPAHCLESNTPDNTQKVYGGYAQSKWAAEYLCRQAGNVTMYRPGLLTGHSRTGNYAPKDYLKLFLEGLLAIGCVPDGDWHHIEMDMTPVDHAVQSMVQLSLSPHHRCYHIAGVQPVSFAHIMASLERCGLCLPVVTFGAWQEQVSRLQEESAAAVRALSRLHAANYDHGMDLFQATGTQFDQRNRIEALGEIQTIDDTYLDRYIGRLLNG